MSRWTHSEDAYLAVHFAETSMAEMIQSLGRTKDAIYCRARTLGLKRVNRGKFPKGFIGGTPFRKGSIPHKTNIRDAIIKALAENHEQTSGQLRKATGSVNSSIWKTCEALKAQNNIHICRWQQVKNSPGNIEAVYRIGAGIDADKPSRSKKEPDIYTPQQIPRPPLGPWGLSWNTTNAGHAPAERNAA